MNEKHSIIEWQFLFQYVGTALNLFDNRQLTQVYCKIELSSACLHLSIWYDKSNASFLIFRPNPDVLIVSTETKTPKGFRIWLFFCTEVYLRWNKAFWTEMMRCCWEGFLVGGRKVRCRIANCRLGFTITKCAQCYFRRVFRHRIPLVC